MAPYWWVNGRFVGVHPPQTSAHVHRYRMPGPDLEAGTLGAYGKGLMCLSVCSALLVWYSLCGEGIKAHWRRLPEGNDAVGGKNFFT